MLVVLILLLLLLLAAMYFVMHKEISSPAMLFIAPFIIMCVIALAFSNQWSFKLHFNTFIVVFLGNIAFALGTIFGDKIHINRLGNNCDVSNEREVRNWKYIMLLIIQVVFYTIKLKYIVDFGMSHGIANDISKCLVYYNNILKFTTEEAIRFPVWLSLGMDISNVFGFLCACILAQQLILKNRDKKSILLILINYIIAVLGGMSSGGRGGSIQVLIALLCAYLILYQRKYNWNKAVPLKNLIIVAIALCGIIYFFIESLIWLGRNEVHMIGRYIANYIGTQIFNLDYILNSAYKNSQIFGQETFYPIIQKICSIFGISQWANYHVGYDSVYAAGYSTGNVYTCFYTYIMDFGYIGSIVITFLLGWFSQFVYRHAKKSPNEYTINFALIFYSQLSYIIAFSFFADKFGAIVFTFNMVKRLMILFILNLFMFEIDIRGLKIVYNKHMIKGIKLGN